MASIILARERIISFAKNRYSKNVRVSHSGHEQKERKESPCDHLRAPESDANASYTISIHLFRTVLSTKLVPMPSDFALRIWPLKAFIGEEAVTGVIGGVLATESLRAAINKKFV